MAILTLDFSSTDGKIKPLHGVNNTPVSFVEHDDPMKELAAAGIPYVRLHDTAGPYGGSHFVDIPNVFPDFNADPADPASYDFAFTDAYLAQMTAAGMEPFYRLGVTIENSYRIKAYHINPPANYQKWAEICAGIVRHYNEGWANGFNYGITYWEIWNEPENPPMWTGTKEQYFELYRVAANYLKQTFPNIKVGGYGGCGFYAITRDDASDFQKSFITYFDDFLAYVTDPATAAPLDFFSWHLYASTPREPIRHAEYVNERLQAHGLDNTENIFNEWNYVDWSDHNVFDQMKAMPGATFTAAVLCLLQSSCVDKAMYYDALPSRRYCGLFHYPSRRVTKTYYSLSAFNELYLLGTQCRTECTDAGPDLYTCAATNSSDAAALLVNCSTEPVTLTLKIAGTDKPFRLFELNSEKDMTEIEKPARDGDTITLAPQSMLLVSTSAEVNIAPDSPRRTGSFAGLDDRNSENVGAA